MTCMLLPVSVSAQIYKWVDATGKVQYGDRPPIDKRNPEQLGGYSAVEATPRISATDWKEKDREFRKRRIEKQMQEAKEQAAVSPHQLCLSARYKLQLLDGKAVYRVNDRGERIYMEDAERNAIETKAQQDISRYCRN